MKTEVVEDIYELSPLQKGLLFESVRSAEPGLYCEQICFDLNGDLDTDTFRNAWDTVIRRHAALRTAMQWEDLEKPYQIVFSDVEPAWQRENWEQLSASDQAAKFSEWLIADRQRGISLSEPPLLRFALIRLSGVKHRFVWSLHHILMDGWSWPLVIREVFACYDASLRRQVPSLPAPSLYRSYIEWLQAQDLGKARVFWQSYLRDIPAVPKINLGGIGVEASPQIERYAREYLTLNDELTSGLARLAQDHQLTLNTLAQGAWALLVSDYTGESDVVFGSLTAGRPPSLADADKTIGFFINTLPVRIRISPEKPILSMLRELQLGQLEAREYDYAPLADLQRWSNAAPGTPIFESIYAFESYPLGAQTASWSKTLQITDVQAFHTTNYPLSISVTPAPNFAVELIYDQTRFDAESIRRVVAHFELLLKGFVDDPKRSVQELPRLTDSDRHKVIRTWNETHVPYPNDQSVHQLFRKQALLRPQAIALVCDEEQVTYEELDRRANRVASYLRHRGVQREEPVGILMTRSIEAIVAMLGVLKSDSVYLMLDPAYPQHRLDLILEDTGARWILAQKRWLSLVTGPSRTVVDISDPAILAESGEAVEDRASADDIALIIYTSGSTGRPKGVSLPHRGVARLVLRTDYFDYGHDQVLLHFAPIAFDASTMEIWGPLLNGGRIVVFSGQAASPQELGAILVQHNVTCLFLTTALFNLMVDNALSAFGKLRRLTFGGEAVSPPHVERARNALPNCRLIHLYGPAENTTLTTSYEIPATSGIPLRTVPIGKPLPNTRVYVLDKSQQPVPVGIAGELCVAGDGLARGYWRSPEKTAELFLDDPFWPGERMYRTGDVVRWLPDGNLEFVGRIDDQVKIRGFRIEPGEIEVVLSEFPQVESATVLVREDRPGDKRLVAYIVARSEAHATEEGLKEQLRARLPEYMIPARFVFLKELPISTNGKVDRRALPAPSVPVANVLRPSSALSTEAERLVANVWRDILGLATIGRDDNFFDLGGHSLSLMQVHSKLQGAYPDLKLVDLFQFPTVGALAQHLTGRVATDSAPVEIARPEYEPIAVVAMSGRFPGARSVDELWDNLQRGVESIRQFSDEELRQSGIPENIRTDPSYVKAGTTLEGADLFDARFFGLNPREADLTDPQHRLFLECAHEVLELAGCDPVTSDYAIGVYAGSSFSTYLPSNFYSEPGGNTNRMQLLVGNDKDFLASRVSYKLNLRGPAVAVQTACSTSLVAVHLACEALRSGECRLSLAGGVSIAFPQPQGYVHVQEGIGSPDGHCRAFDENARGTVGGNGVAIVALKRLSDAIADGNAIHAIIRGSAINNDGSNKVGYTAPSVDGQAAVIAAAQAKSGVKADSIGCIEAHGTGTQLGDVIEIAALKKAFGSNERGEPYCAIGSLKTNLGHLDAAAGVTGLIKAVLQVKHATLAPSLHFTKPNPKLGLEDGPFYVNSLLRAWPERSGPRRAGVSSFGIGGTNAHVVIEQAPEVQKSSPSREWHILALSAKSQTALEAAAARLAGHLDAHKTPIADAAYTAASGRTAHNFRRAVVCDSIPAAIRALHGGSRSTTFSGTAGIAHPVAFVFPGQGSQYPGMGRELYEAEPAFRATVDSCAEILRPHLNNEDIRDFFLSTEDSSKQDWTQTRLVQPALFVLEYALARLWQSWGIAPECMIGHSIGEYVAACLAGVMTVEDAVRLVAIRGRLMQSLPSGAMIAVTISADEARSFAGERACVAAENGPHSSVLSGTNEAIDELEQDLGGPGTNSAACERRTRSTHG